MGTEEFIEKETAQEEEIPSEEEMRAKRLKEKEAEGRIVYF
jgi:hypothetical protein